MFWKKYKYIILPCILIAIAGALAFLYFNEPLKCRWLPRCIFSDLTGIYCPGCGATRATYHLIHGNILMSLRNNLLMIPLLSTGVILLFKPQWAQKVSVSMTAAIAVIAFMILRNLPFYPFTLLAPVS